MYSFKLVCCACSRYHSLAVINVPHGKIVAVAVAAANYFDIYSNTTLMLAATFFLTEFRGSIFDGTSGLPLVHTEFVSGSVAMCYAFLQVSVDLPWVVGISTGQIRYDSSSSSTLNDEE